MRPNLTYSNTTYSSSVYRWTWEVTQERRKRFLAMALLLEAAGYRQDWFSGGPPFPPHVADEPAALGRRRLAYFYHEDRDEAYLVDARTGTFHRRLSGAPTAARGAGLGQLARDLKAAARR